MATTAKKYDPASFLKKGVHWDSNAALDALEAKVKEGFTIVKQLQAAYDHEWQTQYVRAGGKVPAGKRYKAFWNYGEPAMNLVDVKGATATASNPDRVALKA